MEYRQHISVFFLLPLLMFLSVTTLARTRKTSGEQDPGNSSERVLKGLQLQNASGDERKLSNRQEKSPGGNFNADKTLQNLERNKTPNARQRFTFGIKHIKTRSIGSGPCTCQDEALNNVRCVTCSSPCPSCPKAEPTSKIHIIAIPQQPQGTQTQLSPPHQSQNPSSFPVQLSPPYQGQNAPPVQLSPPYQNQNAAPSPIQLSPPYQGQNLPPNQFSPPYQGQNPPPIQLSPPYQGQNPPPIQLSPPYQGQNPTPSPIQFSPPYQPLNSQFNNIGNPLTNNIQQSNNAVTQAASAAGQAANSANQAANSANQAASSANQAAQSANQAVSSANQVAGSATQAPNTGNQAAINAGNQFHNPYAPGNQGSNANSNTATTNNPNNLRPRAPGTNEDNSLPASLGGGRRKRKRKIAKEVAEHFDDDAEEEEQEKEEEKEEGRVLSFDELRDDRGLNRRYKSLGSYASNTPRKSLRRWPKQMKKRINGKIITSLLKAGSSEDRHSGERTPARSVSPKEKTVKMMGLKKTHKKRVKV